MENGKIPAFQTSIGMGNSEMKQMGLTKREYMATQILAGISSNRWSMENGFYTCEELAEKAVKQTDALLEALSKP